MRGLQTKYEIKSQSCSVKFAFLGETQLCQKPLESWKEGRTKLLTLQTAKLQLHTHRDGFGMGGEEMRFSNSDLCSSCNSVAKWSGFFFLNYKKEIPSIYFLPQLSNKTSW